MSMKVHDEERSADEDNTHVRKQTHSQSFLISSSPRLPDFPHLTQSETLTRAQPVTQNNVTQFGPEHDKTGFISVQRNISIIKVKKTMDASAAAARRNNSFQQRYQELCFHPPLVSPSQVEDLFS